MSSSMAVVWWEYNSCIPLADKYFNADCPIRLSLKLFRLSTFDGVAAFIFVSIKAGDASGEIDFIYSMIFTLFIVSNSNDL